jgi:uncharacterized protein
MDKDEILKIAKEYVKKVKTRFLIKKAYLYGSAVKGTFNENSDIDIAIFVENIQGDILTSKQLLFKLTRDVDLRIEPILFTSDEDVSGFKAAIINEGILIT